MISGARSFMIKEIRPIPIRSKASNAKAIRSPMLEKNPVELVGTGFGPAGGAAVVADCAACGAVV